MNRVNQMTKHIPFKTLSKKLQSRLENNSDQDRTRSYLVEPRSNCQVAMRTSPWRTSSPAKDKQCGQSHALSNPGKCLVRVEPKAAHSLKHSIKIIIIRKSLKAKSSASHNVDGSRTYSIQTRII